MEHCPAGDAAATQGFMQPVNGRNRAVALLNGLRGPWHLAKQSETVLQKRSIVAQAQEDFDLRRGWLHGYGAKYVPPNSRTALPGPKFPLRPPGVPWAL